MRQWFRSMRSCICLVVVSPLLISFSACSYDLKGARPEPIYGDQTMGVYVRLIQRPSAGWEFGDTKRPVAIVSRTVPGGPAERAGLQAGDWILWIDGHRVIDAESSLHLIRNAKPGSTLRLKIRRYTESMKLDVPVVSIHELEAFRAAAESVSSVGRKAVAKMGAPHLPTEGSLWDSELGRVVCVSP